MANTEKAFNQCIERMMRGESMESCLASFPRQAAELEPLLKTALNVSWKAAAFEPRPGFQDLLRARLEGAHMYARQQPQRKPARSGGGFSLQRAWVPAMIAVLAVIFSGVGTVAASSYAMPDETLYPVKEATENVRLALAFSDTDKAKVNVKLAETRSEEIAIMASEGKTEQVGVLTNKLSTHLHEAQLAISRIEEAGGSSEPLSTPSPDDIPPAPPAQNIPPKDSQEPPEQTVPPPDEEKEPPEENVTPSEAALPDDEVEPEGQEGPEGQEPAVGPEAKPSLLPAANTSKRVAALKQEIESNITKNMGILEGALNEAPENTRAALQSAIDLSKENYTQIQQGLQNLEKLPKYRHGSASNTGYKDLWNNRNKNATGTGEGSGDSEQQNTTQNQEQQQNQEQEQEQEQEEEQQEGNQQQEQSQEQEGEQQEGNQQQEHAGQQPVSDNATDTVPAPGLIKQGTGQPGQTDPAVQAGQNEQTE